MLPQAEAVRTGDRQLLDNRSKVPLAGGARTLRRRRPNLQFLGVHITACHKTALNEALRDPGLAGVVADTKAAGELRALDEFFITLEQDPDRAQYGPKPVKRAADVQAIKTLMVTDSLFQVPTAPCSTRAAADCAAAARLWTFPRGHSTSRWSRRCATCVAAGGA